MAHSKPSCLKSCP